jgi:hypothetical protein
MKKNLTNNDNKIIMPLLYKNKSVSTLNNQSKKDKICNKYLLTFQNDKIKKNNNINKSKISSFEKENEVRCKTPTFNNNKNLQDQINHIQIKRNKSTLIKNIQNNKKNNNNNNNYKNKQIIDKLYDNIIYINNNFYKFLNNILTNKNFKIQNDNSLISKNEYGSYLLKSEKFWIIYIEYLFKYNKIKNIQNFLFIINFAFKFMTFEFDNLKNYYLNKCKNMFPIKNKNNKKSKKNLDYINLLNENTKIILKQHNIKTVQKINIKKDDSIKKYLNKNKSENKIIKCYFQTINFKKINEEILDQVDDKIFKSIDSNKKKSNNENLYFTPMKNIINNTEEIFPSNLVEGSIQQFNQSFINDSNSKSLIKSSQFFKNNFFL